MTKAIRSKKLATQLIEKAKQKRSRKQERNKKLIKQK